MRVLLVSDLYPPMVGGVPTVVRTLAVGLADRGHQVHVLAPSPSRRGVLAGGGDLTEHLVPSLPWPLYEGFRQVLPTARIAEVVRASAPDVVHVHSPLTTGEVVQRSARRRRVPVVATNHYLPVNALRSLSPDGVLARAFSRAFYCHLLRFYGRCDLVTAPTGTALQLLRRRGLDAWSEVVSGGVDLSRFAPGPPDEALRARLGLPCGRPLLVSVVRLSGEKRVDLVVDALQHLPRGPHLAVASTGPELGRLRAQVHRLRLDADVTFVGHVPGEDLPGLYRLADAFVVASEAELQSLATLEALACGVPVVAADAGALPELVRHGVNGLLFRPRDSTALAGAVAAVVAAPRALAGAARASVGHHERERVVRRWEELYGRAAARPR